MGSAWCGPTKGWIRQGNGVTITSVLWAVGGGGGKQMINQTMASLQPSAWTKNMGRLWRAEGPCFWHRWVMTSSQPLTRCSLLNCFNSWPDFFLAVSVVFSNWIHAEKGLKWPFFSHDTRVHWAITNSSPQRIQHSPITKVLLCSLTVKIHLPLCQVIPEKFLGSSLVDVEMGRLRWCWCSLCWYQPWEEEHLEEQLQAGGGWMLSHPVHSSWAQPLGIAWFPKQVY